MQHITRVWRDDVPEAGPPHAPPDQTGASMRIAEQRLVRPRVEAAPAVSIVLVARAGQRELTRALEALANQTYSSHLLEVITVCATRDEGTARAVAALARKRPGLRLRFVNCGAERSAGAARNCGWRRATGSIIGFTTDAVVPSPRWVESAVRAFDPIVDVVSGQVVVPLSARPSLPMRRAAERLQSPWTAHNVFYRRSLLRELDGFDEAYVRQGHDEADLILTALTVGARFCAAEDAVVVHESPRATWRDELSRYVPSADDARLYRKHPRLAAQYVRPTTGVAGEYLALGVAAGALVCVATGHRTAAKMAAALWAGVTFAQASRAAHDSSGGPRDLPALLLVTAAVTPLAAVLRLYAALRHRVWYF